MRARVDGRFRGSDDDLRQRFEEYICAALSSIKFSDFLTKGQASDVTIIGVCEYSLLRALAALMFSW